MMTRKLIVTVACSVVLSTAIAGPIVLGERGGDLRADDLAALLSSVAPDGSVWLVSVGEAWVLSPPNLTALVYLDPENSTPELRRGRAIWLDQESVSEGSSRYEWKRRGAVVKWAQVAVEGKRFGSKLSKPGKLDRPFIVQGDMSDADVVSLVRFVRTSPSRPTRQTENPDGTWSVEETIESVDGTDPVSEVVAKASCFFTVTTERRPGAGQIIEVARDGGDWQIVSVVEWVV